MQIFSFTKIIGILLLTLLPIQSLADEPKKQQGPPPMLVEVALVEKGTAEPQVVLVGTVYYTRVSRVASEISGIVEKIHFTEGARVKAGEPLLTLRSDLLKTRLAGTRASYEQAQVELQRARKNLHRIKALYQEKSVSESLYDDNHYTVLGLEKQTLALKAVLDHQQLELEKTTIPAPFSGLVQAKLTEQGEWVSIGGQVALIADDRSLEVHVEVPQKMLSYLYPGQELSVKSGGKSYQARFIHFIPQGDLATRTFTVKLKLKNAKGLIQGMEARALLPSGPKLDSLLVPRDAVLKQAGQDILFLAVGGKAKVIPVEIRGYQGMLIAVKGDGLASGQQVVIKGNERIRDDQAIRF